MTGRADSLQDILLLGCGKMGTAMLSGWLADVSVNNRRFTIIDPQFAGAEAATTHPLAASEGVRFLADADELATDYAPLLVILAVKPQMMQQALAPLAGRFGGETVWLSIAAGLSISWFQAELGQAARVIRSMPNTPAAIGRGITALYPSPGVPEEMMLVAERMMQAVGAVVRLQDEAQIDAVTAISGSGPAYVFLLREVLAEAAGDLGLEPVLASALAEATLTGAAALLEASEEDAATLRRNVTSPGGTTQAALQVLMDDDGLAALLRRATRAARDRAVELGS